MPCPAVFRQSIAVRSGAKSDARRFSKRVSFGRLADALDVHVGRNRAIILYMEAAQSVRFRVVFELTLPEADPEDPSIYNEFLDAMKAALENAPMVRCTDILLREAERIAANDDDKTWREPRKRLG